MKILQLLHDNMGRAKQPANLVRNSADEATLYIYDVIDTYWGVSAQRIVDQLASVAAVSTLHLRINSPGGDVFQAKAIAEAIKRFAGKTIAHIDSLAASAATSIAIACDEVEMSAGAFFMIHNASGMVWGDKTDMRETADLLEKVESTIVADYTTKTGQDAATVTAWMDAETWFTAEEAIANGFVDRLAATSQAKGDKAADATNAATKPWNLAAYAKAPQALSTPAPAPVHNMTQANANRLKLLQVR